MATYLFRDDEPFGAGITCAMIDAQYGTLQEDVPQTGEHGGGYGADQAAVQPPGTIMRFPITSQPTPTPTHFKTYPDTSFELNGPDGIYTFQYNATADGVSVPGGPFTQIVEIGAAPPVSAQLVMLV